MPDLLGKLLSLLGPSRSKPLPETPSAPEPPALPRPPAFDLQRSLAGLILQNSRAIDHCYPDDTSENRVVDTHVGPISSSQSKQLASTLIAASRTHGVDLSFLVALTYVNARWSPETFDHGLRLSSTGFSFDQTRWGIGLFYGKELRRSPEFQGHSEGFILQQAHDIDWSIRAIAAELAAHLDWATFALATTKNDIERFTGPVLDQELQTLWLVALAFDLRDRQAALDVVFLLDAAAAQQLTAYPSSVIEFTRKFRTQLTEPST